MKVGDYDIWYKPCERCGYDTGRSAKKDARCWKCNGKIYRDFSKRALKPSKEKITTLKDTREDG